VLATALISRIHDLIKVDIWIDEANSILIAKSSIPVLLEKLSLDANPPLYYFILHFWIQLFGDSELAVRAISCIAGVCLTGAIYFVGKRLFTPGIGFWAAWIVALSPIQIFHSQQARMYSLLALFGLLSVSFLVAYLEKEKKRDQWLWVIFTALALYTHNFALYLLPIEAVLIVLSGKLFRKAATWIMSGAAIALIYSPWIPYLLLQLRSHDNYAWFIGVWKDWGPFLILKRTCQAFSPGGEFILFTDLSKLEMWHGWPALISWMLTIPGLFLVFKYREKAGLARSLWLPIWFFRSFVHSSHCDGSLRILCPLE
jgi:4-amino-4-deoxy-L-arabinose transferase-like glycosyltransferase